MFNKLFRCKHDWFVVEESKTIFKNYDLSFYEISSPLDIDICNNEVSNRVCLKCGECDMGIERAKEEIKRDKQERTQREKLAKQLWDDGCKNK